VACGPSVCSEINAQLTIRADEGKETINPNIYGHFAKHLGHLAGQSEFLLHNKESEHARTKY
jgi:alpha-L-arabinofuranosidase